MRSRKYDIPLHKIHRTIRVIVYADRSVEMGIVDHDEGDEFRPRAAHLQRRSDAAWTLAFARHEYTVTREEI